MRKHCFFPEKGAQLNHGGRKSRVDSKGAHITLGCYSNYNSREGLRPAGKVSPGKWNISGGRPSRRARDLTRRFTWCLQKIHTSTSGNGQGDGERKLCGSRSEERGNPAKGRYC